MQWLYQQKDAGGDDQSNQNFVIYHGSRLLFIATVSQFSGSVIGMGRIS
jgi:hypothetical protein